MISARHIEAVRIAFGSILAHKLRSFLTLIGIIIGVASVVVVGAAISGLNTYVIDRVSKVLGVNHFMIARMAASGQMTAEQWERMDRRNKRLDWKDFHWVDKQCASCDEVGAQIQTRSRPGAANSLCAGSLSREPRITIGTTGRLARVAALNAPS